MFHNRLSYSPKQNPGKGGSKAPSTRVEEYVCRQQRCRFLFYCAKKGDRCQKTACQTWQIAVTRQSPANIRNGDHLTYPKDSRLIFVLIDGCITQSPTEAIVSWSFRG